MASKALIFSDLQATDGHERCFGDSSQPLQLWRVRKFFQDLYRIYTKYECSYLWDLGDLTDDRSYIPIPALDAVAEGLDPFPDTDFNIKLIGNHEQYLRDTTLHIGRIFQNKFIVVDKAEVLEGPHNCLIACAAFPASNAALADWLSKTAYAYRNYDKRLLLGHFQVAGCEMNSGKALLGIPAETLAKYSLSLLGHVHKPQEIGRNGFYVGSPFQQNFGEKNESKRVGVLDLDSMQLTWVPMPGFPEYRVLDFEVWAKSADDKEEHRTQVIIRNPKQAEAYYRHPLMSRAEPIYNYEMDDQAKAEVAQTQSFQREDVLKRWVNTHPLAERGIVASTEEILEVGQMLAEAQDS